MLLATSQLLSREQLQGGLLAQRSSSLRGQRAKGEVLQANRQIQGYCVGFYRNHERKQINTDFQLTKFEMLSFRTVICDTNLMGRKGFFLGE